MMISPEMFYERELKGKSAEAIQAKIRGLKNKMGRLKSAIESQKMSLEPVSQPSPATMLACYRHYLARAKQALINAGGEYPLSSEKSLFSRLTRAFPSSNKLTLLTVAIFRVMSKEPFRFRGKIYLSK